MINLILFITLLAIIWYTIETRRLANFTAKQIKINIKPLITVIDIDNSLSLKNIGKSPALNILVKDVIRIDNDGNKYVFKFTKIALCGSSDKDNEVGAGITPHYNGQVITGSGRDVENTKSWFLAPNSVAPGQNYELIIDYEDIEKGKWRSISIVDNEGVHFKEVNKRDKVEVIKLMSNKIKKIIAREGVIFLGVIGISTVAFLWNYLTNLYIGSAGEVWMYHFLPIAIAFYASYFSIRFIIWALRTLRQKSVVI